MVFWRSGGQGDTARRKGGAGARQRVSCGSLLVARYTQQAQHSCVKPTPQTRAHPPEPLAAHLSSPSASSCTTNSASGRLVPSRSASGGASANSREWASRRTYGCGRRWSGGGWGQVAVGVMVVAVLVVAVVVMVDRAWAAGGGRLIRGQSSHWIETSSTAAVNTTQASLSDWQWPNPTT